MVEDPWQQRISWQRLLRETFTAWWQRAWVWLGLGGLMYLVLVGNAMLPYAFRSILIAWLAYLDIPILLTVIAIVFFHLSLRLILGKEIYPAKLGFALRVFLPVLLLEIVSFIIIIVFQYVSVSWAVRVHGISAAGYFMPSVLSIITLALVLLNILIIPITLLVLPIIMIERVWPIAALKRGWTLMSGRVSHLSVLFILLFSPLLLFALAILFLPPMDYMSWCLIGNGFCYLLINPWIMIAAVILYRDLLLMHYRHPGEVEEWAVEPFEPSGDMAPD
ncbi:MAG: hypothetical protein ACYDCO_12350 [Armatimonadota bacterium]